VFSPGHTAGHCGLHLREKDVNLETLTQLAQTGASLVLPGHGEPWTRGIEEAVAGARSAAPVSP
jgi:glyoxylase-like metal-dependent hydrolase (beta-lactamase superfamily II)